MTGDGTETNALAAMISALEGVRSALSVVLTALAAGFIWLCVSSRATFEEVPGVPAWWVTPAMNAAVRLSVFAFAAAVLEIVGASFLAAVVP